MLTTITLVLQQETNETREAVAVCPALNGWTSKYTNDELEAGEEC